MIGCRIRMIASVLLLLAAPAMSSAEDLTAACFTGGEEGSRISVWVYEGHVRWQDAREDFRGVLVFSFSPGQQAYDSSELVYCHYAGEEDRETREASLCESGFLEISDLDLPTSVSGDYRFRLSGGKIKRGHFDATYCTPKTQLAK